MKTLNFLGSTYYMQGDHEDAVQFYMKSLQMAEALNQQLDLGIVFNNLGTVYFDLTENELAGEYYEKAIDIFTEIQDTSWLSKALSNVAGVHFMNQEYEEAAAVLERSIELGLAAEDWGSVGGSYGNLAAIYVTMGQPVKAEAKLEESVKLLEEVADIRAVAIVTNQLANLYVQQAKYSQAIRVYEENLERAMRVGHEESISKAYQGLAVVYQKQGNHKAALENFQQHIVWKDSLFAQETLATVQELESKYQLEKKDHEIEMLTKDNELRETEMLAAEAELARNLAESEKAAASREQEKKLRKRDQLLLGIGLVALAVVVVLVVLQLRLKQRKNQELAHKNKTIANSLKEREMLVREVHHRVKNNFQLVSSILGIQAHSLADETAKRSILDSRAKIQSMATMHRKLYAGTSVSSINAQEYLGQLIEDVESANAAAGSVSVEHELQSIPFDIDTAIPIGLILTELLTNAYKHAFTEGETGMIKVTLMEGESGAVLSVQDNGVGWSGESADNNSFGWKLINSLVGGLSGELVVSSNSGTLVTLNFSAAPVAAKASLDE